MTKIIRLICQHTNCRVLATSLLILASILLAGTSFAKIVQNTIDPVAVVSADGRSAVLTGPLACDQKQTADLRVTLPQRTTGAIATGQILFPCTPPTQQWEVEVRTKGKDSFEPGAATALAVARTFVEGGESDDAHR
jgi:hypothetical protein